MADRTKSISVHDCMSVNISHPLAAIAERSARDEKLSVVMHHIVTRPAFLATTPTDCVTHYM